MGTDAYVNYINNNFDFVCISVANIIRKKNDVSGLANAMRDINVPLIILGVGLQVQVDRADLHSSVIECLEIWNTRAAVFGTRGDVTTAWLKSNGYVNARTLGCPSMYAYPDNVKRSLERLDTVIQSGQVSSLATAGHLFHVKPKEHAERVTPRGVNLVKSLPGNCRISYIFQDEPFSYTGLENANIFEPTSNEFDSETINKYLGDMVPGIEKIDSYGYFENIDSWRMFLRMHDIYIGDRLHCGIAAMQSAMPSVILANDVRVGEIMDFYSMPKIKVPDQAVPEGELISYIREQYPTGQTQKIIATYTERLSKFDAVIQKAGIPIRRR